MAAQEVTVICLYCKRNIDGYFWEGNRQKIIDLGTNETKAVAGEYKAKKGYLHQRCATGIQAEEQLNTGATAQTKGAK